VAIEIVTNNVPRDVLYWHQLPEDARNDFDYLESEEAQQEAKFFEYKDSYYDLHEFDSLGSAGYRDELAQQGWHAVQTDSAFSAIVIKWANEDYDSVVVGRASW
jgi:hypothetical protein